MDIDSVICGILYRLGGGKDTLNLLLGLTLDQLSKVAEEVERYYWYGLVDEKGGSRERIDMTMREEPDFQDWQQKIIDQEFLH